MPLGHEDVPQPVEGKHGSASEGEAEGEGVYSSWRDLEEWSARQPKSSDPKGS